MKKSTLPLFAQGSVWRSKLVWRFWRSAHAFRNGIASPIRDQWAWAQLLAYGIALYLLFVITGSKTLVREQLIDWVAVEWALPLAIMVFVIVNVITAPFRAYFAERKEGRWQDNEFILAASKRVYARRIYASDSGKPFCCILDGIPPNSFIRYTIELQPTNTFWNVQFGLIVMKGGSGWKLSGQGGARIGQESEAYLFAEAIRPDVSDVIVRVWIHSFVIGSLASV